LKLACPFPTSTSSQSHEIPSLSSPLCPSNLAPAPAPSDIGASAGETGFDLERGSSEAIEDDRLREGRRLGVAGVVTERSGDSM